MKREQRLFAVQEARALERDGKRYYCGRAVVYSSWSDLLFNQFREQIAPGCFDKSLAVPDREIICTVNHNADKTLGRMGSGTLGVYPDAAGIYTECLASTYSYARDLEVALERRDIAGMSFTFDVKKDSWSNVDGLLCRTVEEADLHEVSFVVMPAYRATDAEMRAQADIAMRSAPHFANFAAAARSAEIRKKILDGVYLP